MKVGTKAISACAVRAVSVRIGAVAGLLTVLSACAAVAPDAPAVFPSPIGVMLAPFASPEDPKALIGHSGREVAGWLGEPHLKRRDPPAELWQYRTPACVVDFFLYGDAGRNDGTVSVSHVEIRPREAAGKACLSAIRANGRPAPGG